MGNRKNAVSDLEIIEMYHRVGSGNETADALGIARPTVYSALKRNGVKLQWKTRKLAATEEEIVAAYERLKNGNKVSTELGVSAINVYRTLRKHGLQSQYRQHMRIFDDESLSQLAQKYTNGASANELAKEYSCSVAAITDSLVRHGIEIRSLHRLSGSEKAEALRLYQSGMGYKAIGERLGYSDRPIMSFLHREHAAIVRPRFRKGADHQTWKGGRQVHRGYVYIYIPDDHCFVSMRDKRKYAPEHRIVCAEKLGRPLLTTETVHHIDGDKLNNAPENLQLRQGRHGKHIVMACKDCGSQNVGPIAICD